MSAKASIAASASPRRFLFQGFLPFDRARLMRDLMAGITLATLGIPEVMGYTKIIGTPVITGLYTILLPMLVFALFGSSRHLVVGADSATAAIVAAALAPLAAPYSSHYIALTSLVALVAGAMLLLARVFRAGFLADFLSRTVLVGFLTGVGVQVALGELPGMLGLETEGNGLFAHLQFALLHLAGIRWATQVNMSNGAFTINGTASDMFIFRVAGQFVVGNSSIRATGGVTPNHILWDITGTNQTVKSPNGAWDGTILALSSGVQFDNTPSGLGPNRGAVIAADDVNNNQNWVFSTVSGFDLNYTPFTPVPEPSSIVLLSLGSILIGGFLLRRSMQHST